MITATGARHRSAEYAKQEQLNMQLEVVERTIIKAADAGRYVIIASLSPLAVDALKELGFSVYKAVRTEAYRISW